MIAVSTTVMASRALTPRLSSQMESHLIQAREIERDLRYQLGNAKIAILNKMLHLATTFAKVKAANKSKVLLPVETRQVSEAISTHKRVNTMATVQSLQAVSSIKQ